MLTFNLISINYDICNRETGYFSILLTFYLENIRNLKEVYKNRKYLEKERKTRATQQP